MRLGFLKWRIEEAAAKRQALIDSGQEKIVGVNQYVSEHEENLEILNVDNDAVTMKQMERLKELKSKRNEIEVQRALTIYHRLL